jgi:hypothetical protein
MEFASLWRVFLWSLCLLFLDEYQYVRDAWKTPGLLAVLKSNDIAINTPITTKAMAAEKSKNKRMHGWSIHEAHVWAKLSSGLARLDSSQYIRALRLLNGLMM